MYTKINEWETININTFGNDNIIYIYEIKSIDNPSENDYQFINEGTEENPIYKLQQITYDIGIYL